MILPPKIIANSNTELNQFTSAFGLTDDWRQKKNTSKIEFTLQNKRGVSKCKIDFWLESEVLTDKVKSDIIPGPQSDHKIIIIETIKSNKHRKEGENPREVGGVLTPPNVGKP